MADGYLPDAELMQLIQQVVRQHASEFQPPQRKLRRAVRRGGGGGGGDVNLKFGVLTSALSAAEGFGTPGEGTVQEKDLATGDDIGGERAIKNTMFTGVLNNYAVWFLENGSDLYLVKPDCTEAP